MTFTQFFFLVRFIPWHKMPTIVTNSCSVALVSHTVRHSLLALRIPEHNSQNALSEAAVLIGAAGSLFHLYSLSFLGFVKACALCSIAALANICAHRSATPLALSLSVVTQLCGTAVLFLVDSSINK